MTKIHIFIFVSFYLTSLLSAGFIYNLNDEQEILKDLYEKREFLNKQEETEFNEDFILKSSVKDSCLCSINDLLKYYKKEEIDKLSDINKRRLRFVYGKCNPVLFVPGLMATRIELQINCKEYKKSSFEYKEMSTHCSNMSICKSDQNEKYVLWPAIFSDISMIKFYSISKKKMVNNNACMAFFMQYYNTPNSCPDYTSNKDNTKSSCRYNDNVKLIPYGLKSNDTNNWCGFGSINDIAYSKELSYFINLASKSSKGFKRLTETLINQGYEKGFSLIATPYDYKESECDNEYFSLQFKFNIESLYENTNKKIIIIAHSYGNINTNYQLSYHPNNKHLSIYIDHFINIAGPMSGTSKAEQLIVSGSSEFNFIDNFVLKASLDPDFQTMIVPFLRSGFQLRKIDIDSILPNEKYNKLREAITKRREYEECMKRKYEGKEIIECIEDKELLNLFPELRKSLYNNEKCQIDSNWERISNEYDSKSNDDSEEAYPIFYPCFFHFRDYESCPIFKTVKERFQKNTKNNEKSNSLCKNIKSQIEEYFLCNSNEKVDKNKNCNDDFIVNHSNSPFNYIKDTEEYISNSKIYNDIHEIIQSMIGKCPKDNQVTDINTTFIFNKSLQTKVGFFFSTDPTPEKRSGFIVPTKRDIVYSGGDGTVQSESVYYYALKALYNKKYLNEFNSNIKFVDYCSSVKSEFLYKSSEEIGELYNFLNCECRGSSNFDAKKSTDDCLHSSMIDDNYFLEYINDVINSKVKSLPIDQTPDEIMKRIVDKDSLYFIKKCNDFLVSLYNPFLDY